VDRRPFREHTPATSTLTRRRYGARRVGPSGWYLAAATFTETTEANANGYEVSADNGNSNANNTVGTILDEFHTKMGRLPYLEECNDIRIQNDERPIAPGTLRNAISKCKGKYIGTLRALEALSMHRRTLYLHWCS